MGAAVLKRWTFRAFWSKMITLAPVAQLDRVSDSDSEGHRFDSCRVYQTPEAFFASGVSVFRAGVLPDANAACRPAGLRLRKRCRHFAVPSPLGAPYASCRVYHTPAVFTAGAFFPSAGVLPMPKRNNTNQPVSDSLWRFSADTTCQYVYYCLRRLREKSSSNSSLTGGTVPRRRFLLRQGNRRG